MDKAVQYCCAARGSFVLAEYEVPGVQNVGEAAHRALPRLPRRSGGSQYTYEGNTFHYVYEGEFVLLCCVHERGGESLAETFLTDLVRKFKAAYNARGARGSTKEAQLTRLLKSLADAANGERTEVNQIERDLEDVTTVMKNNIEKVMERGENITSLLSKTTSLSIESFGFRNTAKDLKRVSWWRAHRCKFSVVLMTTLVSYVIAAVHCGTPDLSKCNAVKGT